MKLSPHVEEHRGLDSDGNGYVPTFVNMKKVVCLQSKRPLVCV
jgi:hypothetical protein